MQLMIFTLVNFVGHTKFLRESTVRSVPTNLDIDDAVCSDFRRRPRADHGD